MLIRNKKTGETKDVQDTELQTYGISPQSQTTPQMQPQPLMMGSNQPALQSDEQPKTITGRTLEDHVSALGKAQADGNMNAVKAIKSEYDREYQYQKDFVMPKQKQQHDEVSQLAKKAKENADLVSSTTKGLDLFEKNYKEAGLKGNLIAGMIPSGTGLSPESADFDSQRQVIAYQLAKSIGGQSGQGLSDKDFAHYLDLVPSRTDTEQQAKNKMNNIRQMIADKYGAEATPSSIEPKSLMQTGMDIGNAVMGKAKNVAQDINAGVVANMTEGTRGQAEQTGMATAQSLEQQAAQEQDPQKKKDLLQQAQALYQNQSAGAHGVAQTFSPDVKENPALRGLEAGSQIAGAAEVIANPVATANAITQPIRHPLQTAKDTINTIRHPLNAAKSFIQQDLANTGYRGTGFPGSGAAETIASKEPVQSAETAGGVNDLSMRDKLAKEFSTSIAVPNEGSVLKSEKTMQDAFRMTTANDPRGVARELEDDLPKYAKATEDYAKQLDQTVKLQPKDEVINQVMEKVRNTTSGRANPQLADDIEKQLRRLLHAGTFDNQAIGSGVIDGTNFEKMNDARKYFNSGKSSWFQNGQPVGTPTNDLNALDWEASKALKDIMSEGDKETGIFKQLLERQHTALEAYPVLSKAVLKGEKVHSVGSALRKGYEEIRNRTVLNNVPRGGDSIIPEITLADGAPAIAKESALLNPAPPNVTPGTGNVESDISPTTTRGESSAESYRRDRRMKIDNPKSLKKK